MESQCQPLLRLERQPVMATAIDVQHLPEARPPLPLQAVPENLSVAWYLPGAELRA